jgi:mannose-6-phosphate isomerase-like protein (cupin superfamily)
LAFITFDTMKKYIKQNSPFVVPTTDGKLIEEHYGVASTGERAFSVAHMVAPPGWSEPHQRPEFDEITLLVKGRKQIEVDGEMIILGAGESILIRKGANIRYSNPFNEEAEYWSICMPAFTIETVHRAET